MFKRQQSNKPYIVRVAFTLAEVLITLGIIGVVAAMTIPTLLNSLNKQQDFTSLQKALSIISQAATQIRAENGFSMAGLATNNLELKNLFSPYLKVVKECSYSTDSENCYVKNTDIIYNLQGGNYGAVINHLAGLSKINTVDGFVYSFWLVDVNCSSAEYVHSGENQYCGVVYVDINGLKKPNTAGKDIFMISINKYNITPYINMAYSTTDALCNQSGTNDWNGADCAHKAIKAGGIYYY